MVNWYIPIALASSGMASNWYISRPGRWPSGLANGFICRVDVFARQQVSVHHFVRTYDVKLHYRVLENVLKDAIAPETLHQAVVLLYLGQAHYLIAVIRPGQVRIGGLCHGRPPCSSADSRVSVAPCMVRAATENR